MAPKERKNPFKELEKTLQEVPPEMKKKVMNDIAAAKLLLDMGSLYTQNYGTALSEFFKAKKNKKDKK